MPPSSAAYIRKILESDTKVKSVDAAVELAMEFRRNWAGYYAPRYLHALHLIQKEVFDRRGLTAGDYTVYAGDLENLFQPSEIMNLDEYGLPAEIGIKLRNRIAVGGGLDAAIASVRLLDPRSLPLTEFERSVVETCRAGL